MKNAIYIFIFWSIIILTSEQLFCPKKNTPPQVIQVDTSYSINPITFSGEEYTAIKVANKIFLNKSKGKLTSSTSGLYVDSNYCPEDFIIPKKEDYESVITQLGSDAYDILTDEDGFHMEEKNYYVTNTKGEGTFNKFFMYLDGNNIKFIDSTPSDINGDLSQQAVCRCMLDLSKIKLVFPDLNGDFILNENTNIQTSNNLYLNGFLWKIEENIFTTRTIEHGFDKSGMHKIEFWGNYINGEKVYLCENIFVKKPIISSSQEFEDNKVKLIVTDFSMEFSGQLHFQHSNCPVAPRRDGGYYIAFTNTEKYLHVLSYGKDDNLIKDFNTNEKAYPHDITATDYGFAIYMIEAGSTYHSYLSLYNKKFELVNTVQIMNNKNDEDKTVDSTLEKQIIRYGTDRSPVYGMRFMYKPDNGKLVYSRGRIFLIFAHYNYFLENGAHTGDTVVTFNDGLFDMDFGNTWGSSHSLIQSATHDDFYFWSAALGDAYPQGIKVEYTSLKDFTNSYDPVNKKYNSRENGSNDSLAGNIKGYLNGSADGKLGGIMYFENLRLYCLIYAKTPVSDESDPNNGKNVIYMTTWKFEDNEITNKEITEIKVFGDGNNVMQVRAGKYGDNQVFIIYSETTSSGGNNYGNVNKGTVPKLYIIKLPDKEIISSDVTNNDLLMNTNEDLRTFDDGVLIWASSNSDGKLVINKIGTTILDDNNEDIDYILTQNDLIYDDDEEDDEGNENGEGDETGEGDENREEDGNKGNKKRIYVSEKGLSTGAIVGITLGTVFGVAIISGGIFFLVKYFKNKKLLPGNDSQSKENVIPYSKNNINSKDLIKN